MRTLLITLLCLPTLLSNAQQAKVLSGIVTDEQTSEPLRGVTITLYKQGKPNFMITNRSGHFSITDPGQIDSIKFSMIGHENKTYGRDSLVPGTGFKVSMAVIATSLDEIVVQPLTALEIIEKAIKSTQSLLPKTDFENVFFYREVIKEKGQYFSVAEAIFRSQFLHQDRSTKLNLIRGRSKEDVSYTRLFEDFHPSGGPESLTGNAFNIAFPNFLTLKKIKWFNYKKERSVALGDAILEVISFDQKPGIHEALE